MHVRHLYGSAITLTVSMKTAHVLCCAKLFFDTCSLQCSSMTAM